MPQMASENLDVLIEVLSSCNSETVVMFWEVAAQILAVLPSVTHMVNLFGKSIYSSLKQITIVSLNILM